MTPGCKIKYGKTASNEIKLPNGPNGPERTNGQNKQNDQNDQMFFLPLYIILNYGLKFGNKIIFKVLRFYDFSIFIGDRSF